MTGYRTTGLVAGVIAAIALLGFFPGSASAQSRWNSNSRRPGQQRPRPNYRQYYWHGNNGNNGRPRRPVGNPYNGSRLYPGSYYPVSRYRSSPSYIYNNGVRYRRRVVYRNGIPCYQFVRY